MTVRRLLVASVVLLNVASCLGETPEPKSAFLLERKTLTTKTGVVGIAAGTRLVIIARHGDMLTVKANDQEFEIAENQVTTDAQAASTPTEREQQEILERKAAEAEIRYKEALLRQQKDMEESARARKTSGAKTRERKLEEIRRRRELLKIELDRIKFQQKDLPPPNSSYRNRSNPRPNIVVQTSPNSLKLEQRRKEIERELMGLDQQERLLKLQSH